MASVATPRLTLHILLFATRESCVQLSCWLRWASHWLAGESAVDYRLHLQMHTPTSNVSATGEFRSSRWYAVLQARLKFVAGVIHELPMGSTMLFSDLDVVPLRPPASLLPLPHVSETRAARARAHFPTFLR